MDLPSSSMEGKGLTETLHGALHKFQSKFIGDDKLQSLLCLRKTVCSSRCTVSGACTYLVEQGFLGVFPELCSIHVCCLHSTKPYVVMRPPPPCAIVTMGILSLGSCGTLLCV